ncbi:MAG TPA: hypothetical protein PK951_10760, partial [Chitinophagaceae bacterium]|nr:hypothetical protein [Chitinophagaceae bacterium]
MYRMKLKRNFQRSIYTITGFVMGAGLLLISGCGAVSKKNKEIFHYNEHSGISSLDPAFAKAQATMWP